jgi:MYXO-CTERM domain-containing protein
MFLDGMAWKDGASRAVAALAVVALAGAAAPQAGADVIGAWNLNGPEIGAGPMAASTGSGMLDATAFGDSLTVMQGTLVGAQPGETAGNGLAVVGTAGNGLAMRFDFVDLSAFSGDGLTLQFATRRSSTGFSMNRIEYWKGLSWVALAEFTPSTTAWELKTFDLAAAASAVSGPLALRIVVDGATGSTGSIRFDNFALMGTPVPAPAGAVALLALAGVVGRRRR